jgi:hypothetical protein
MLTTVLACVLAPVQSAILGMHSIVQRPMVVAGKIEARPMMYVALTYDHRLVDGREVRDATAWLIPRNSVLKLHAARHDCAAIVVQSI